MTAQSPNAYLLSAALHGSAAALLMLLVYTANPDEREQPRVFELVAGGGNNYAATEAPALGIPGGIKAVVPRAPPAPEASPATAEPAPSAQARDQAVPNFKKSVQRVASRKAARLEAKYKKELEAEERRRLSYEQFEKELGAKGAASKGARVDAEGIREGVIGGSTANTKGGAGGRALTREEGDLLEAYFALLKARVRENFVAPPDVSEKLAARVVFHVGADGTISGVRLAESSGNAIFDQAVADAFERTPSIGPRPDGRSDEAQCAFSMREEETP
jgi:colicin import membrane protein